MRKYHLGLSKIFFETMHGFDLPFKRILSNMVAEPVLIKNLSEVPVSKVGVSSKVLGLLKGPRTLLTNKFLEAVKVPDSKLAISYIGRDPKKILDKNIICRPISGEFGEAFYLNSPYGDVHLVRMNASPLSEAVASYVVGMAALELEGKRSKILPLSIQKGNTFS
ncbi:MAG: hypothetical protein KDJ75_07415 [Alphaproteobacteria bacterium]|nr:hypothetical protein [Alphaproteobacteria bacterium]